MELGGKASAIVCQDADLDLAATQCALGAFLFSGQICMSTERILVHECISGVFEGKLIAAVRSQEEQMGQHAIVINDASLAKNAALLQDAVGKGAVLLNGSVDKAEEGSRKMQRAVVKGVTPDMKLYKTESFGPSVSLLMYSTEGEAICEFKPQSLLIVLHATPQN
jgi:acyl-CoA reductase-like NAD-dependent aldehyde dehydrogenase